LAQLVRLYAHHYRGLQFLHGELLRLDALLKREFAEKQELKRRLRRMAQTIGGYRKRGAPVRGKQFVRRESCPTCGKPGARRYGGACKLHRKAKP
jgi:hypothetical protein